MIKTVNKLMIILFIIFTFSCGKKGPPVLKDVPEEKPPDNTYNVRQLQLSVIMKIL